MHAHEHFLRDVFGLVFVAGKSNRPPKDEWLIRPDERGERALIPLARARDELRRLNKRYRETAHHMNEPAKRFCVYRPTAGCRGVPVNGDAHLCFAKRGAHGVVRRP